MPIPLHLPAGSGVPYEDAELSFQRSEESGHELRFDYELGTPPDYGKLSSKRLRTRLVTELGLRRKS